MSSTAVVVDGGGTSTRIGVVTSENAHWERAPTLDRLSRATIPAEELIEAMARTAAGVVPEAGIMALSIAGTQRGAESVAHKLRLKWTSRLGELPGRGLLVVNDVVPLLDWRDGRESVAAICGTGTGYASRACDGTIRRASGAEFVLSDEGGAFDVGLSGLRAATRAYDGRGPATSLTAAASRFGGPTFADLHERIYGGGPTAIKATVAAFAPYVVDEADEGDEIAYGIVDAAAGEIVSGIVAVASGLADGASLTLSGSMFFAGSPMILDCMVRERLERYTWFERIDTVADACEPLTALARAVLEDATTCAHLEREIGRFLPCVLLAGDRA